MKAAKPEAVVKLVSKDTNEMFKKGQCMGEGYFETLKQVEYFCNREENDSIKAKIFRIIIDARINSRSNKKWF